MAIDQQNLLNALSAAESLAQRGKLNRFTHHPIRYVLAMLYSKCLFPWFGKERMMEADTFFGDKIKVILPAGTDILLTHAKSHDSELRLAKYLTRYLKEHDVFVDAGAHFGYFSLLAHRLGCHVVAFEASATTFNVLQKNCADLPRCNIQRVALSNQQGEITFYEFPGSYSEYNTTDVTPYFGQDWFEKVKGVSSTVPATSLDAFFAGRNTERIDCIKLDVEGHEWEVLKGAEHILTTYSPVVIMEYHTGKPDGAHVQAVNWMEEKGYRVFVIQADGDLKPCFQPDIMLDPLETDSENLVFMKTR